MASWYRQHSSTAGGTIEFFRQTCRTIPCAFFSSGFFVLFFCAKYPKNSMQSDCTSSSAYFASWTFPITFHFSIENDRIWLQPKELERKQSGFCVEGFSVDGVQIVCTLDGPFQRSRTTTTGILASAQQRALGFYMHASLHFPVLLGLGRRIHLVKLRRLHAEMSGRTVEVGGFG